MSEAKAPVWKALRRLATIRSSNVDKTMEEGEEIVSLCNYVDVYYHDRIASNIEFSQGSATSEEIKKFSLREGDVLITKDSETPDDIAVPALVEKSAEGVICGYHLAILRSVPGAIHAPYLFWSLKAKPIREAFSVRAQGVTRYGLTLQGIGSVPILVHDLKTQIAIADFLDRETRRIDQLVKKKERQIELLRQRAKQRVNELLIGQSVRKDRQHNPTRPDEFPDAPQHWTTRRAGLLFQQVAEPNVDDCPVLSVSIHHGISDRQLDDEERDRKVNLIEDRSSYKRVRPGYLAYNMMRAWQGAVGVSTVDGAVSPAYVVAKPTHDLHSRYYQYLLRTPLFVEQMRQRSKGITDFRLRLYWEQFRQILLPFPPLDEQKQMANEAERILNDAAKLADMVAASVERLKERRSALVTEAVLGQIDVRGETAATRTKPTRARFRMIVGAEIVSRHQGNPKFGRVKLQKELYLAEAHLGIEELGGNYLRYAAGPYDEALIQETERGLETAGFYRAEPASNDRRATSYTPMKNAGRHTDELKVLLGPRLQELRKLVELLSDFDKDAVEAVATLYAVWNDALIDGGKPDDAAIIQGFLTEWHRDKQRFKESQLHHWLAWMRRNGLTPYGKGPRTSHTMTQDLFAT